MGYEINIAKQVGKWGDGTPKYEHHFATNERSIGLSYLKLQEILGEFKKAYPSPKFVISITKWQTVGEKIGLDDEEEE